MKKNKVLQVRVSPEWFVQLRSIAKKLDVPVSYVIRQAIKEWLERNGE